MSLSSSSPSTPVALFVRVSKQSQDLERQIHDVTKYANEQGWTIIATIAEKISGASEQAARKGITELLDLVKQRRIRKVLVTEISRLGRRTSDVLTIIETLSDAGVSVYAHNYRLETLTPEGKRNPVAALLFTFLAEFARLERETLVERIHSGLEQARRRGKTLGRPHGSTLSDEQLLKNYPAVVRYLKQNLSLRQTAKLAEVSVNTVRKVKAAMKQQ
jgi:DNA invertase Pin-like site-specific DNA recombinase